MIKLFYDTETTGVDHRKHSIIQLGGLIERDGEVLEEFSYRIRPHEKAILDPTALRINKTTEEEVMSYPHMQGVLKDFMAMLGKYIDRFDRTEKMTLVGFRNMAFDDLFLRKWFELCGNSFFGSYFWSNSVDVSALASEYLLDRRPAMASFKLHRVAQEVGLVFDKEELHEALEDARLTREVYNIVTGREMEI